VTECRAIARNSGARNKTVPGRASVSVASASFRRSGLLCLEGNLRLRCPWAPLPHSECARAGVQGKRHHM